MNARARPFDGGGAEDRSVFGCRPIGTVGESFNFSPGVVEFGAIGMQAGRIGSEFAVAVGALGGNQIRAEGEHEGGLETARVAGEIAAAMRASTPNRSDQAIVPIGAGRDVDGLAERHIARRELRQFVIAAVTVDQKDARETVGNERLDQFAKHAVVSLLLVESESVAPKMKWWCEEPNGSTESNDRGNSSPTANRRLAGDRLNRKSIGSRGQWGPCCSVCY